MFIINGLKKDYNLNDLDQLRKAIKEHREEGKKIISHYMKMNEYYSDWEDKLVELDRAIHKMAEEKGITREEVEKPDKESDMDFLDVLNM